MQVYTMTHKSKMTLYTLLAFLTTSFTCIETRINKSFEICTPRLFIVSTTDSRVSFM